MLVLFDIDGTLITTRRAGLHAMQDAVAEVCGAQPDVSAIAFAGRLDPLILAEIIRAAGAEATSTVIEACRRLYRERLRERLAAPDVGRILPGVDALVGALRDIDGCRMGLVTGNFEETGRDKLEGCGFDCSPMEFNGFGDECPRHPPHRRQLPGVAMARWEAAHGRPIDPVRVVVVGDTPADVDCARHGGCRSLAVATGLHSREDLAATDPDLCLPDLADTDRILSWMLA